MSKYAFKHLVKKQLKDSAFNELLVRKAALSKMAALQYHTLEMQKYLVGNLRV